MAGEKKLEQEGKGLLRLSLLLIVLAVGMLLVLFDIYFVPSGTEWEEIKQEYAYDETEKTDKEMWYELRDAGREHGILVTPSNILNWFALKRLWNEEKQENARREESLRIADERAAELQESISEAASGYEIPPKVKFYIFLSESGNVFVSPDCCNYGSDVTEKCEQLSEQIETELHGKYPDETASIVALISGKTCKAVAYAPDIKNALKEGLDFPYFDDEGNFSQDYRRDGGITNISKNGFIIGLSPQ